MSQIEVFLGEIIMFAGDFAPDGWAFCDGRLLEIAVHQPLYSLIGTIYGGDGVTTFALPDLRGRAPVHIGNGQGMTPRKLGDVFGMETVTLKAQELPPHSHKASASLKNGSSPSPDGKLLAAGTQVYTSNAPDVKAAGVSKPGGDMPHENMAPFMAINYIIALNGVYPTPA